MNEKPKNTEKNTVELSLRISKALNNRLVAVVKHRKDNEEYGDKVTELLRECIKAHLPTIESKLGLKP